MGPGMVAPPSAPMQAPGKYFSGPSLYSQSLSASQRSSDKSQGSMDRSKRRGKNVRKPGMSQGSAFSSQNYGNLMSQESYTAFDDFGLTSQESQSQTQNTQDL